MRGLLTGAALIAWLCGSAVAEEPSETVEWAQVAGWDILVDMTVGGGCFIATIFESDTILRIGFDPSNENAYLMLGNMKWSSIEDGKDYPISLQLDDESPWTATGRGGMMGDLPVVFVHFTDSRLLDEVKRKHGLRAMFMGRQVANLNLAGSSRALDEMMVCQNALNEIAKKTPAAPQTPSDDPFAMQPNVRSAADPFAM